MILGSRMVSFLQKVMEPKRHTEAGSFQGRFAGMRDSFCEPVRPGDNLVYRSTALEATLHPKRSDNPRSPVTSTVP